MRTEEKMMSLILDFAKKDKGILAVYMNGSRTNPNVPKDIFQDYDIVYVVDHLNYYINNKDWISYFGDILIMQEPDKYKLYDSDVIDTTKKYTYLMQFTDGNRIDLTFINKEIAKENFLDDKLTLPLLDKDNILPKIPMPSDIDYHVKKPSQEMFFTTCNEFWWVSLYVAKGLWRKEILYAIDHLNFYVRPMLFRVIDWYVGINNSFSLSVGKNHKYLQKFLPNSYWERILKTYPDGKYQSVWDSLFEIVELFAEVSRVVAKELKYDYHIKEEENVIKHLKVIKNLKEDALKIV